MSAIGKTTVQLYRDCLRLANHIGSNSPKGRVLKSSIRSSFKANKFETNVESIERMKSNAVRALANYMLAESGLRDSKLKKSIDKYSADEANTLNKK
jgi:hypothetical protein